MSYSLDDVFNKGDFAEILGRNDERKTLNKDRFKVNLELTLNYPENAAYKRMTEDNIKLMYIRLWDYVLINQNLINYVVNNKTNFEYGKKAGKIHMHILLELKFPTLSFCCEGLVKQIVRCWQSQMPKKYSIFKDTEYYPQYFRYRCPSICCQIQFIDDKKRTEYWTQYIEKDFLSY